MNILEQIRQLAAANDDIAAVWLYGSRAKGNVQPHSDYDVAVAFNNFQLSSLEKYLRPNELAIDWSTSLGLPSDTLSIVDINLAPIYLAYNIVETGTVLYSQETSRVFREQDRIYSQFEYQQVERRLAGG
ncbi:nucleotidyltransferase domain-containing protein [Salinispirillum marinum]|uniref:Nucleotidyltransferase domain-containing protein n=2 Tax=Saccharospirillaceae TaxID=255527 RepID=A0ABV8BD26_9GAMM